MESILKGTKHMLPKFCNIKFFDISSRIYRTYNINNSRISSIIPLTTLIFCLKYFRSYKSAIGIILCVRCLSDTMCSLDLHRHDVGVCAQYQPSDEK